MFPIMSLYPVSPVIVSEAQMALTGTSSNRLQVKLKDVEGRLTEAENRQMLAGPKGPKGDRGYSGLPVRIVISKCLEQNPFKI